MAGGALGDIHLRFAWQVWHLEPSTFVLRGRRGTFGTGLALVARLVASDRGRCGTWSHPPSFCVAGAALMALVWWHAWTGLVAGDAAAHHTVTHHLSHNFVTHHLSHTTLSHTIFHTPSLRHPLSHTIFDTPSLTHHLSHHFVTHHLSHTVTDHLSHTIFHTPLCLTPSFTTPSFTHHFVTHHLSPHHLSPHHLSQTTLSHTIFHTQLCHMLSFTHNLHTHHLSHTTLTHTQTCSETSYRITDVECIARAQTIQ